MKHSALKGTLFALTAVSLLAACGGSGDASGITLTVWEDQSNIATLKARGDDFVAEYKRLYPGAPAVTINWVEQAEGSAMEKMVNVASTGNGPDVLAVTHDTIITGATAGVIAPISYSDYVANNMSEDAQLAVSVVSSTGNKSLYGYPITAESQTIIYDSSKITATELASFEALKTSGKKLGITATNDGVGYYMSSLLTDAVLFGEDGTVSTSVNLHTTKALNNIASFYNDYAANFIDVSPDNALASMASKDIVGFISSPYMYAQAVETIGSSIKTAVLPTLGGEALKPFSGYKAYCVNSYSTHPSIAQDLAKFLVNADSQWTRLDAKNYYPSLAEDEFTDDIKSTIKESVVDQTFGASLALSRRMPSISLMANYWSPAQSTFTDFWTNNRGSMTTAIATKGLAAIEDKLAGK